jgi:hypothetical protein
MAAALEHGLREELRRPDLAIACFAHAPANMRLDHPIKGGAARVPEHHPGRVVLLVEQVQPVPEAAMVVFMHDFVSVKSIESKRRSGFAEYRRPRPSPGGAFGSSLRVLFSA